MKTRIFLAQLALLLVLLTSCVTKTPETITISEIEYRPITLDIGESVDAVFHTRPELAPVFEIDDTASVPEQILLCAVLYKQWGEDWQDYAMRLEDYIRILQEKLLNPEIE